MTATLAVGCAKLHTRSSATDLEISLVSSAHARPREHPAYHLLHSSGTQRKSCSPPACT
eukprot:CAMPEP_0174697236 /NCGR_PEP_ID=MMETSP1094-20130205/3156_1 /TAXON_ID=156173 /ORGANISM="Chrysochromulina brevifilum, Strain UTEX LB 985" /LENGTH=58 /DNA_ID=CAMNT_0015894175 /DNA_START=42 /DNA_END=218 /DNA_ORIENTATION=+